MDLALVLENALLGLAISSICFERSGEFEWLCPVLLLGLFTIFKFFRFNPGTAGGCAVNFCGDLVIVATSFRR